MSDTTLLIMRHLDDLEPARALVTALAERRFALSFANEDLRTRFGETVHASSTDPFEYVLNADRLSLALCFFAARELGAGGNFLLLNFLDELGVPTVELQRDLLRDAALAERESVAKHYVAWSGPDGTGYLKSKARAADARLLRDDVVLVTSLLASSAYSEEERYQFAFAVMRLAREYPQLSFLWRASAAEEQNSEAKLLLAMLGSSGPENLWLEDNEPIEALLVRASSVITMGQTALLDYAAAKKPAVVYVNDDVAARLQELSFLRFARPDGLLRLFSELRTEPQRFVIESRVPALSPDTLRAQLVRIEQARTQKSEFGTDAAPRASSRREVTLRYLGYMQDARARADLGRLSPQLNAMDKRLIDLEKLLLGQREKQASESAKSAERKNGKRPLSVAQKAWKLAREVKKRAFKP
jgi:hypothetical protein